ncbi:uncharacterized protein PV09_06203 [Verruconis gallopava]|uniref:DNA 3'-5' helicase n=1 Tax=Verruconis gallopava TaxID=253628 RepID=A0A0D1YNV6_9PEZI|nr:uncharacterized protein PV09_06203 [Verruconis gallopava]KIW02382.1 hypothetical protein PV09_06203 [Verruconis gallopava]
MDDDNTLFDMLDEMQQSAWVSEDDDEDPQSSAFGCVHRTYLDRIDEQDKRCPPDQRKLHPRDASEMARHQAYRYDVSGGCRSDAKQSSYQKPIHQAKDRSLAQVSTPAVECSANDGFLDEPQSLAELYCEFAPHSGPEPLRASPETVLTKPFSTPKLLECLSTRVLPDRLRSVFPYPNFNAMQTKCFPEVFQGNDNFVLSSPTGSGKTVIFELAICRVVSVFPAGQFKIIYQAPTKSLCSERRRDWQKKFSTLQIECAELTGDTDPAQMRSVQSASIIITTPEKWDSVTRKWKDHQKLMNMIKLFLIDEVHMLHDERGATLEAVVSRMKSVQSDVRFIALSATVPNLNDIARWLGRNFKDQDTPARREHFGEEYRPVQLQKHVNGYYHEGNDFSFEKLLDTRLKEVIAKFSHKKPIIVFCFTRRSCETTARLLANWWSSEDSKNRHWPAPRMIASVEDKGLAQCARSAVAWHHAGLLFRDRIAVEQGFVDGNINVICCTSTLAVGVNLPCHMVIIKNTVTYANSEGIKEYSDLEIMQMLGRAGRPQYDTNAVAVIMTRQEKVGRYKKMVSGEQVLESCLHEHLIDHINAEIGLGTVNSLASAKRWLSSTFLYVRLGKNPGRYRLDGGDEIGDIDARLENICQRDINTLREHGFVKGEDKLESTDLGEAMARYCVHFETAKVFSNLPRGSKLSDILSALAMASEWKDLRFRGTEKSSYKEMNKSPQIRFPIPVNLDSPAHKVSLIIQSHLGGVSLPTDEKNVGNGYQYQSDTYFVFQHIRRLIRCIIDFKVADRDSVSLRNALFICRSIGARCWDDSPLQMKQLEKIGVAGVRKLVAAGIESIEALEAVEAHRIESILQRNPPFGHQVLDSARAFPKLRISLNVAGKPTVKAGYGAKVSIDAEIGFLNETPPSVFHNHPIFLVFLAETSDGKSVHFARASAKKVGKGQLIKFAVNLTSPAQAINCYVMCEEIAGTCTCATINPTIPSVAWPSDRVITNIVARPQGSKNVMNTSRRRSSTPRAPEPFTKPIADEFGDELLDEDDLIAVLYGTSATEYQHIDSFILPQTAKPSANSQTDTNSLVRENKADPQAQKQEWKPIQLRNGKWECNHRCKDKQGCKHFCCNHGLDKPPKAPKIASLSTEDGGVATSALHAKLQMQKGQTTLDLRPPRKPVVRPSADHAVEPLNFRRESSKSWLTSPEAGESNGLDVYPSYTQRGDEFSLSQFKKQLDSPGSIRGSVPFQPVVFQYVEETKQNPNGNEITSSDPVPSKELSQPRTRYDEDIALVEELTGGPVARQTLKPFNDNSDSIIERTFAEVADAEAMRQRLVDNPAGKDIDDKYKITELVEAPNVYVGLPLEWANFTSSHWEKGQELSALNKAFIADVQLSEPAQRARKIVESGRNVPMPTIGVSSAWSRKRRVAGDHDASDYDQSLAKRRHVSEVERTSTQRASENPEPLAEQSDSTSGDIDPTILQMYGPFVDFV